MSHQALAAGRLSTVCLLGVVALAMLAGTIMVDPEPGYGYRYRTCGKACYAKRCRRGCAKATRTCSYCMKQDAKASKSACKALKKSLLANCIGDACKVARQEFRSCRAIAKTDLREGKTVCKASRGACASCCKGGYGDSCNEVFRGTPGFGTYFSRYGGHRYKPDCER